LKLSPPRGDRRTPYFSLAQKATSLLAPLTDPHPNE